jgi:hypothetical protein
VSDRNQLDSIDARLAELGKATEPIRARRGFAERVMLATSAENGWQLELLRSARRSIPFALVAAIVALSWAVVSESATDAAIAVADDSMDLEW